MYKNVKEQRCIVLGWYNLSHYIERWGKFWYNFNKYFGPNGFRSLNISSQCQVLAIYKHTTNACKISQ